LAELGARESIPSSILLHPCSSHGVPEELRVEARRQGAIDGGGEAMRAQATVKTKRTARIRCRGLVLTGAIALATPSKRRRSLLLFDGRRASEA
jgi:hypothetical protein